jgi:hypothetical protein
MSDIVERLTRAANEMRYSTKPPECVAGVDPDMAEDAAAEITRLSARVAELEEGLGLLPFNWLEGGACVDPRCDRLIVRMTIEGMTYEHEITVGDLRRARALTKGGE